MKNRKDKTARLYSFKVPTSKDWDEVSPAEFWDVVDNFQGKTVQRADDLFSFVAHADMEVVRKILLQYRFFIPYYTFDLAILVAKLKDSKLRSFLADMLSDDLGRGESYRSRATLYDNFLISIGIEEETLDVGALQTNLQVMSDLRERLIYGSDEFGIGLRGMGLEEAGQAYIVLLYKYLKLNPHIQTSGDKIDWRFWYPHVGEHESERRLRTRSLIHSEIVKRNNISLCRLGCAYEISMNAWRQFWNNTIYAANGQIPKAKVIKIPRVEV